MSMDEKLTKAERLAIAGVVAPSVRASAEVSARRRVHVVDVHGNVVRQITGLEAQKAVLRHAGIEFDVLVGKSGVTLAICETPECARLFQIRARGRQKRPTRCPLCRSGVCSSCKKVSASRPFKSGMCKACFDESRRRPACYRGHSRSDFYKKDKRGRWYCSECSRINAREWREELRKEIETGVAVDGLRRAQ
jgi:hypothetical protein